MEARFTLIDESIKHIHQAVFYLRAARCDGLSEIRIKRVLQLMKIM